MFYIIAIIILTFALGIFAGICKSQSNKISNMTPYKLGSTYRIEKTDYIYVSFDSILQSVDNGQQATLFDLLSSFWSNPAQELNKFYESQNRFGISLQIVDIRMYTKTGKYVFIVKDLNDKEYILKTAYVPKHFEIDMQAFKTTSEKETNEN